MSSTQTLGLLAGQGTFPVEVTREARRRGERVVTVGIRGLADPALEVESDLFEWVHLGQLQRLCDLFAEQGVTRAVVAGKIPKTHLYDPAALHLDPRAVEALRRLADRKDDSIQGALAAELEREGVVLVAQPDAAPGLFAGAGPLGSVVPSEAQWGDAAFGWAVARALGAHDIGQSVVVRDRAVVAVEAIEGTDATIARAGELAPGGGLVVVKVTKPGQDPRFDMPAIGLDTLKALAAGGAGALFFEAGRTVVLDREALAREADAQGVAVVGVPPEGPA
jgi:DUF1009 family protein